MRIGLDMDNVITDFDKLLEVEMKKLDKSLRNRGVIDENARHVTRGKYDLTNEEIEDYLCKYMEEFASRLEVRDGAKYYMDKLLDDGHELIILTNRPDRHYKNAYGTTIKWLNKNSINYTKLVITKDTNKTKECKEENVDIMFDDNVGNCIKLKNGGVNVCIMGTSYNKNRTEGLPIVMDWKELYNKINAMQNNDI